MAGAVMDRENLVEEVALGGFSMEAQVVYSADMATKPPSLRAKAPNNSAEQDTFRARWFPKNAWQIISSACALIVLGFLLSGKWQQASEANVKSIVGPELDARLAGPLNRLAAAEPRD